MPPGSWDELGGRVASRTQAVKASKKFPRAGDNGGRGGGEVRRARSEAEAELMLRASPRWAASFKPPRTFGSQRWVKPNRLSRERLGFCRGRHGSRYSSQPHQQGRIPSSFFICACGEGIKGDQRRFCSLDVGKMGLLAP